MSWIWVCGRAVGRSATHREEGRRQVRLGGVVPLARQEFLVALMSK